MLLYAKSRQLVEASHSIPCQATDHMATIRSTRTTTLPTTGMIFYESSLSATETSTVPTI